MELNTILQIVAAALGLLLIFCWCCLRCLLNMYQRQLSAVDEIPMEWRPPSFEDAIAARRRRRLGHRNVNFAPDIDNNDDGGDGSTEHGSEDENSGQRNTEDDSGVRSNFGDVSDGASNSRDETDTTSNTVDDSGIKSSNDDDTGDNYSIENNRSDSYYSGDDCGSTYDTASAGSGGGDSAAPLPWIRGRRNQEWF